VTRDDDDDDDDDDSSNSNLQAIKVHKFKTTIASSICIGR
jgi:hypothetical protein